MSLTRLTTLTLSLCSLLVAGLACDPRSGGATNTQSPTPTSAQAEATTVPKSATCALLSNEDIQSVQGEAVTDAQGSEHLTGGLVMSQCFYRLPTFNKSINLEVIRPDPNGGSADAVVEFWRQRFHSRAALEGEREREKEREREREKEREKAKGQVREGGHLEEKEREEEDGSPPQPVAGVGDEAFWGGNQITAALFVRRKDTIIRLSIGGPEDTPAKIKKASALARKVLKHF
jgi:hypothetical protein